MKRFISFIATFALIFQSVASYAQPVMLPQTGTMMTLSERFAPVVLKGMVMHPEDPLLFDFVVDNGQTGLAGDTLTGETTDLVKYFLAALAVPQKDLWVNLSPIEKDRIITDDLGRTAMGRDMLAQDYILKQITASLLYPENALGKNFWSKVYALAQEKLGTTNIPVNSFNKVWITPADATVFRQGNRVLIANARLNVQLESDYLAQDASLRSDAVILRPPEGRAEGSLNDSQELSRQILREVIIPVLEKEVNEGKNFARVRQIFHSLILANWYRDALKESLLGKVYANAGKTNGLEIADPLKEKQAL